MLYIYKVILLGKIMNQEESNNHKKSPSIQKKIIILEEKIRNLENLYGMIEKKDFRIDEKIQSIEIRLKSVEISQGGYEQNWKTVGNFIIQLIWVIMAAYILLKLGIQPPI